VHWSGSFKNPLKLKKKLPRTPKFDYIGPLCAIMVLTIKISPIYHFLKSFSDTFTTSASAGSKLITLNFSPHTCGVERAPYFNVNVLLAVQPQPVSGYQL
jgi:hypothetical protein